MLHEGLLIRSRAKVTFTNREATTHHTGRGEDRPALIMLKHPAWLRGLGYGDEEHREERGLRRTSAPARKSSQVRTKVRCI